MTHYRTNALYFSDMGSINPMIVTESSVETKEENLLWHINSMRRHDGLREWSMETAPYQFHENITYTPLTKRTP